jgi:hypothetical protein
VNRRGFLKTLAVVAAPAIIPIGHLMRPRPLASIPFLGGTIELFEGEAPEITGRSLMPQTTFGELTPAMREAWAEHLWRAVYAQPYMRKFVSPDGLIIPA